MALKHSIEHTLNQVEQTKAALARAQKKIDLLLKELNLSPEQADDCLTERASLFPEEWTELQQFKKEWEEKVDGVLKNVRNPNKVKKQMGERASVQPHWLFVR